MIAAEQSQWISGLTTEDRTDSFTLIYNGSMIAHIQRFGRMWEAFWYDGSSAGLYESLGAAMDDMEGPAPECVATDCDNLPLLGMLMCSDCLYEAPANVTVEGK